MLEKLTREYISAFDSKDLGRLADMLCPDFALEDPVVRRLEGRETCLEAMGNIFKSCKNLSFSAKNIYVDCSTSMIEFVLLLDDTRLEGVDIIEWHEGKLKELRAYVYEK